MSHRIEAWQFGHWASNGFIRCFLHTPQIRSGDTIDRPGRIAESGKLVTNIEIGIKDPRIVPFIADLALIFDVKPPTMGLSKRAVYPFTINRLDLEAVQFSSSSNAMTPSKPELRDQWVGWCWSRASHG
jgi:hypothetical protein